MRAGLLVLGIALGVLWLAGLSAQASPWLVWLDFAVAALSVLTAAVPAMAPGAIKASPFGFGVALLALWIVALSVRSSYWMTWWTFGFGVAYLLFGLAVGWPEERPSGRVGPPISRGGV